jgi:hypothetical protein
MVTSFRRLLATFGWHASVDKVPPKLSSSGVQGRKDCYYIGFSPTLPIPCKLPRKCMGRVFEGSRPIAIKFITRRARSYGKGHCITVDAPDGLYLVGETLQPTHNSWAATDFTSNTR